MGRLLVVIDVQNDFVTGSLGTKEAQAIVPNVLKKVKEFDGGIYFTQDTHQPNYLETEEGKNLPVIHCVEGSNGWNLIPELADYQRDHDIKSYVKDTFASIELANEIKKMYLGGLVESVELIGLCTDICVVSNALILKAYMPELPVRVDSSCCAGVTPQKHEAALETMRSCQIEVK